uniref:Stereocilin LRR domain-containing protein n=1 Tax=Scleropages formosus TaxID=113540 RepID=A0A8C9S5G1_SCLFO
MPQESIRTLLMSAEKEAVKRFLSHMHQSWGQLQVETEQQAMETMTSAFIHKFARVTPDLFVDLSQFIPFMSVSDIMTFPTSLMVNDSVILVFLPWYITVLLSFLLMYFRLTAIRDHSSEMKSLQKRAFIKRLLQSKMVDEVPSWPPYFLSSILPLLPYLPVCENQSSVQVHSETLPALEQSAPSYSSLCSRMGALVCYVNPDELHQLLLATPLSQPLWQQLAMCISEGHTSSTSRGVSQEESISGSTLDLLGPLMPFLGRNTFRQVGREALKLRLDEVKGFCLPRGTMEEMGRILMEKDLEPASWTVEDVEHAGRLVFALPSGQIGSIPLDVLSTDVVEQVLESQHRWEDSEVGRTCEHLTGLMKKKENFVQGIVRGRGRRRKEPTPSCADVKGTFPSAWRAAQLGRMAETELGLCVEDLGLDESLSSEQRQAIWSRLRQAYGPVKSMTPERILELGCIVTEMSERELHDTNLVFPVSVLCQMRAAMLSFLRHSGLKLEELGETEIASLGHLLCGLSPAEITRLAALFLRELSLPCTEQQSEALASVLSQSQAFGPVSDWGSQVFAEIGTLAVGLPDIVMSSLVREQVEGLTPVAIAQIPPRKLAVVFSVTQLSWLTAEQASVVTEEQWDELSSEQKRALSLALYEGEVLLEHRGKLVNSQGLGHVVLNNLDRYYTGSSLDPIALLCGYCVCPVCYKIHLYGICVF